MDLQTMQVYCMLGWAVFPLNTNKKPFAGTHGFKDATLDQGQIAAWHTEHPGCAWGVATSDGHGVFDVDAKEDGLARWQDLVEKHGPLPPTPCVRTGGGGMHYWLRWPAGTNSRKPAAWCDRKCIGGYVIVPPSKIDIPEHEGRAYSWEVKPWEVALAEAPDWLIEFTAKDKPEAQAKQPVQAEARNLWVVREMGDDLLTHPGTAKGLRRPTLLKLAGMHLARGDSEPTVYAMAQAWAARCKPPLEEWAKHIDGLMLKERAKALGMTTPAVSSPMTEVSSPGLIAGAEGNIPEQAGGYFLPSQPTAEQSEAGFFPSFPAVAAEEAARLSAEWPILEPAAYHGLFGEMLKAIEPQTEADPVAVLLGWLACFGSVTARGAWLQIGPDRHHPALFVGVVGTTSSQKGMAWAVAKWPFARAEPGWMGQCVCNGVGSGQGLIERVRDESRSMKFNKKLGIAEEVIVPGAADKRCLLRLDELAACFKLQRSDSSTLGETLLTAWGGEMMEVPNRSGNELKATGYSIAAIGDTQPGTLKRLLRSGRAGEEHNGWMNRFLWACVRSPRSLPSGGDISVLGPFLPRLTEALAFAQQAGEMHRDEEADALWGEVYSPLKESADDVPHTDRARPYAVRLSMVYALADHSATIRRQHLEAALAVWGYCRDSARLLFGEAPAQPEPSPEPVWLKLLSLIQNKPGIGRSELLRACRKADAGHLDEVLTKLASNGMAFSNTQKPDGGGRPAECWWPGPGQHTGLSHDNQPLLPAPDHLASNGEGNNLRAGSPEEACAEKERQEGKNSLLLAGGEFVPSFPVQQGKDDVEGEEEATAVPADAGQAEGEEEVVIQTASADGGIEDAAENDWLEDWFLEDLDR